MYGMLCFGSMWWMSAICQAAQVLAAGQDWCKGYEGVELCVDGGQHHATRASCVLWVPNLLRGQVIIVPSLLAG